MKLLRTIFSFVWAFVIATKAFQIYGWRWVHGYASFALAPTNLPTNSWYIFNLLLMIQPLFVILGIIIFALRYDAKLDPNKKLFKAAIWCLSSWAAFLVFEITDYLIEYRQGKLTWIYTTFFITFYIAEAYAPKIKAYICKILANKIRLIYEPYRHIHGNRI